jgi:hypothetical protein
MIPTKMMTPRLLFACFLSAAVQPLCAQAGSPQAYEQPATLQAAALIDESMLTGPAHRVRDRVPTDGYMGYFTIDSDFGTFECVGKDALKKRIQEIQGIKKLVEVSKSEVFADGLKRSVQQPVEAVKNIAADPVGSVKAVPATVGHFFAKVGNSVNGAAKRMKERADENGKSSEEAVSETLRGVGEAGKGIIGYETARLACARQLQVDPYTDLARLQDEMSKVSWVFFSGGLPLRLGAMAVSGGASTALTATKFVGLPDEIYTLTPSELDLRNQQVMDSMKVPLELRNSFNGNPAWSTSLRRSLMRSLEGLGSVPGRQDVLALAASCSNRRQADFLAMALGMVAERHAAGNSPIEKMEVIGRLPAVTEVSGALLVPAPVDYVSWTEEVAGFAMREDLRDRQPILLHTGAISPVAAKGLETHGWRTLAYSN